jgi:hypothetical protein
VRLNGGSTLDKKLYGIALLHNPMLTPPGKITVITDRKMVHSSDTFLSVE